MKESEEDQAKPEESTPPTVSSQHLKEQAELFRQLAKSGLEEVYERSLLGWKKYLYLSLVFGVLFLVVFLLLADRSRRQLIASAGEGWSRLSGAEQNEIFRLPPPPPQAVQTKVLIPGGSASTGGAEEEPVGVLFLDETLPGPERRERTPAPLVLAKSPFNEAAYDLLTQTGEVAGELTENHISEFEFKGWRPVKDAAPEFWIDLVVMRRSDGEEVHLIWSVNTETGQVTPLSQAARDLEASQ